MIAAGGTGGHVIPAMDLAVELKKDGSVDVEFIGVGLDENAYFLRDEHSHVSVRGGNFSKGYFKGLSQIGRGFLKARKHLKKKKPDRLVGFGSYHSLPAILAAMDLKIPFDIVELNTLPGKINRFFSSYAKYNYIHFDIAAKWLKGEVVSVDYRFSAQETSLEKKEALACFGLHDDKKTVLIFGGSQGADSITDSWLTIAEEFKEKIQVIHVSKRREELVAFYKGKGIHAFVTPFIKGMDQAFAAADFSICRSGAGALRESVIHHTPAIMIPFPRSMEGHQMINADYWENVLQGGYCVPEGADLSARLKEKVKLFLTNDENNLKGMRSSLIQHKQAGQRRQLVESIRSTL